MVRPLLDLERAELRAARHRRGPAVRRRRDEPRSGVRAQPDPLRGPAGAPGPERRRRAEHRRDPGGARTRRPSCSNGSSSRRSRPRERAPARSRSGRRRWRAPSRRSGAWPCAPSRSEPRAARCRSGARRAAQIMRLAMMPEGGEVDLGLGVRAICEQGLIRFETSMEADAAPGPGSAASPGELPVRAVGGPRRASRRAARARRAPTWRPSTRKRSATSWSSARGAMAIGCGHSAWTAPRACRTCSPIAAFRVPSVTASRW